VTETQPDPANPADALRVIGHQLVTEGSVISPKIVPTDADPVFGKLVAAGPRAAKAPGEYAIVFEAIREGFLLHYGTPRLMDKPESNLALLAGDYLYALGLGRLSALDDPEAVAVLADLVAISADLCARNPVSADAVAALWVATATSLATGIDSGFLEARQQLRSDPIAAAGRLAAGAEQAAEAAGLRDKVRLCAASASQ